MTDELRTPLRTLILRARKSLVPLALVTVGAVALPTAALGSSPQAPGTKHPHPRRHHVSPRRLTFSDPAPSQSQWFDYKKNLNDPTLTYTQQVWCNQFTPSRQATLYPYNVQEAAYQWAYRNQSSSGVTVTPNNTNSSDMNNGVGGMAFFVTSLHFSGDYAFGVSLECQSNDPLAYASVDPSPSVAQTTANRASIDATFNASSADSVSYWVQYGTSTAVYTNQSQAIQAKLSKGSNTEVIPVPNLQPGTTYHYRVVIKSLDNPDNVIPGPSY